MSNRTQKDDEQSENEQVPVNPADRGEESNAEVSPEIRNEHSRSSSHNKQSQQNQDLNTEYDPTQGKRHDQIRRNDKRGQMGG
jgi:hypothetical protein